MKWLIVWSLLATVGTNSSTLAARQGNSAGEKRLNSAEIQKALSGKIVFYSPADKFDADISELYVGDSTWDGTLYTRGPVSFSGRWFVENDQLCVVAGHGVAQQWHPEKYCRDVWQDPRTGQLQMDYLRDSPNAPDNLGRQTLRVSDLPPQITPPR